MVSRKKIAVIDDSMLQEKNLWEKIVKPPVEAAINLKNALFSHDFARVDDLAKKLETLVNDFGMGQIQENDCTHIPGSVKKNLKKWVK